MGSFRIEYETQIRPKLINAIEDALNNEVKSVAINAIEDSASRRVYESDEPVYYSRRYSLLKDQTYDAQAEGNTLTITAHPVFYGGESSADLGDVIAEGLDNYNMPFPRPWMDEGISDWMDEIESALKRGLQRNGF